MLRNCLVGEDGNYTLSGGGDDVLVGGTTTHDTDDNAIIAILIGWSAGTDPERVATLRGEFGAAAQLLRVGVGVLDDGDLNAIEGRLGRD